MNKKILLVEDEAALTQVLCEKFVTSGFKVLKAHDGKQGLEVALKHHPDLILLDIIMPVMDGMTMLQKLKQDAWGKKVKVIVLTNLSDNSKIDQFLKEGVYSYLIKSDWKLDEIVAKVKRSCLLRRLILQNLK